MKTSLLFLAAGSLLLASCKSGQDNSGQVNPPPADIGLVSKAGRYPIHRIDVLLTKTNPAADSHQVTWKLRSHGNQGFTEPIYSNQVVQWHFTTNFFLYIDESQSHVDWNGCMDADGNLLVWTNCVSCPFDQTNHHRALCASNNIGDWVISVVFPSNAAPYKERIKYRLVTGFDCVGGKRAMPYDYYMVEALLVWDDAGKKYSAAPSQ